MLELELEQCRASYQREYDRTRERLEQLEVENIELCKSIDENTLDNAMKLQISNVINENLVRLVVSVHSRDVRSIFSSRNFINKFKRTTQKLES